MSITPTEPWIEATERAESNLAIPTVTRSRPEINNLRCCQSPKKKESESSMAEIVQVQCINKSDRYDAHERIKSIGGIQEGKRWKLSETDAIAGIEAGKWKFFVSVQGKSVWVVIAVSRYGHKYLKTEADDEHPNNLLSLPECPP